MTTITLKINERTKAGKAFMALADTFFINSKGIEIIATSKKETTPTVKKPYNTKFVSMVKNAEKSGTPKRINPNNIWESIM